MPRRLSRDPWPAIALIVVAVVLALMSRSWQTESDRNTANVEPSRTAASTSPSTSISTPTPRADTLVEGIAGRPLYLNPLLAQFSPADRDLTTLLFSGLTKPGEHGEILPDLAERWEVSGDGKEYTFFLRQQVRWHDGTLFTADDVSATIKLLQDPAFPGVPALAAFWRKVAVVPVDASTVRFVLPEPYAPFPQAASIGILQGRTWAAVQGKSLADSGLNDSPVGTGPYKLKDVGEDQLILEANADYYGQRPKIGEITVRFYPDTQSLAAALRRGEVMAAARLQPEDLATLKGSPEVAQYRGPLASYLLIFVNTRLPYFQDRGTRQALLYALDRQGIVDRIAGGAGTVLDSPILPYSWAYDGQVKQYGRDPEQAKSLLDKVGWKPGSDGVRARDEVKLQFTLLTNDDPLRVKLAEEISRQWATVGVKADVQAVGITGLMRDYLQPRRFDAVLFGWSNLGSDPDPYELWHSSQASADGGNYASLVNPSMDELLEDARHTSDRSERVRLYARFQELFAEQVPALLLYEPWYTYAVRSEVGGIRPVALADPSDRFRYVSEWTVVSGR